MSYVATGLGLRNRSMAGLGSDHRAATEAAGSWMATAQKYEVTGSGSSAKFTDVGARVTKGPFSSPEAAHASVDGLARQGLVHAGGKRFGWRVKVLKSLTVGAATPGGAPGMLVFGAPGASSAGMQVIAGARPPRLNFGGGGEDTGGSPDAGGAPAISVFTGGSGGGGEAIDPSRFLTASSPVLTDMVFRPTAPMPDVVPLWKRPIVIVGAAAAVALVLFTRKRKGH